MSKKQKIKKQMKKGFLEYAVLMVISKGEVYSSDILDKLADADLITVEGTIYPLLSRLAKDEVVSYRWVESESGPPRKYYSITNKGQNLLNMYTEIWKNLNSSLKLLSKNNE